MKNNDPDKETLEWKKRTESMLDMIKLLENKMLVIAWNDEFKVNGNKRTGKWSWQTLYSRSHYLKELSNYFDKPFKEITKIDLIEYFNFLMAENKKTGKKGLQPGTMSMVKSKIKAFYYWYLGNKERGIKPEVVSWISCGAEKKILEDNEFLYMDDIEKMIKYANSWKKRFMIMLLFETGYRNSEFRTLKLKDIGIDTNDPDVLIVKNNQSKTFNREIKLVKSTKYYIAYMENEHPYPNDKEAYLFYMNESQKHKYPPTMMINSKELCNMIKHLGRVSKLDKKVSPKLFRDSRAKYLKSNWKQLDLNHDKIEYLMGWVPGSKMISRYGRDTKYDISLFKKNFKIEDSKIECKECHRMNDSSWENCSNPKCGLPLNPLIFDKQQHDIDKLKNNNKELKDKYDSMENTLNNLVRIVKSLDTQLSNAILKGAGTITHIED